MNEPRRDLLPDASLARDENFCVRPRRVVHLDFDVTNGRADANELCFRWRYPTGGVTQRMLPPEGRGGDAPSANAAALRAAQPLCLPAQARALRPLKHPMQARSSMSRVALRRIPRDYPLFLPHRACAALLAIVRRS